ncbi:MAG TPA: adenine phosphoribosyltransferase [Vicinamibacterales bacterium]|nr:adenine phosphoribosyltransferase [Vicinamibacterales bacterium]
MQQLRAKIRHVPDFPKPGIVFYDITTLLADPAGFRETIAALSAPYTGQGIDRVVGVESRGFILASAIADRLGAGFVPIRKPGKLPSATLGESYALEYGTDSLEIHDDALGPGHRVLVVDDVLATGGTARAAVNLVQRLGSTLHGAAFLIELDFLKGRDKLAGTTVFSVLRY